jgi:hypothetical protein
MTLTARHIARQIIILIVILVTLTALAIWLELGPVVHSSALKLGPRSAQRKRIAVPRSSAPRPGNRGQRRASGLNAAIGPSPVESILSWM